MRVNFFDLIKIFSNIILNLPLFIIEKIKMGRNVFTRDEYVFLLFEMGRSSTYRCGCGGSRWVIWARARLAAAGKKLEA